MRNIAVLYGGSSQHQRTYKDSEFAVYINQCVPIYEFATASLDDVDVLIIPSQTHAKYLHQNIEKIYDFANHGKIVVTLGSQTEEWLPAHQWEFRPTNFWWWLDPNAHSGLKLTTQSNELFTKYLTIEDATWHQHGVYWPTADCEVLLATTDGAAVFYIDRVNTNGVWINTTLDPDFHFGSYFMPATTRFLRGFLPWLKEGEI